MLYLVTRVMFKYRFFYISLFLVFSAVSVRAQKNFDVGNDHEGVESIPIKISIDYNVQKEKLKPKLDHKSISRFDKQWIGYVKSTEGKVFIKRFRDDGNIIMAFPAEKGSLLTKNDVIDIEKNGRAELEFRHGDTINLGPLTVIKIEQEGTYTLLTGSMRLRAQKDETGRGVSIYAPNVAVFSKENIDLAVRYNDRIKTSSVVCFGGSVTARGVSDAKGLTSFEKGVNKGEIVSVITTYEKNGEAYIASDPEKISLDSKKDMLESFYSDPEKIDSWAYTKVSTGFFRFTTSLEYVTVKDITDTYTNFSVGYVPLIYLGSVFYIEPYFYASLADPFKQAFFRAGGSFQVNPIYGAYVGLGGGAFWTSRVPSGYGADLTGYIGYTLAEKIARFIDGARFSFFASQASKVTYKTFMFSIVINIGRGRDLY